MAEDDTAGPVLQTVPLGTQWPTVDPFLFCAHHLDRYPAGDGSGGPAASLDGRNIGADFDGIDGWNMYHGTHVPGFPEHPHRGFETVTYLRSGLCDHADSLGATARFGAGDAQWLTAGGGVVHSEMFTLTDATGPNPLHLFQIWLNLPAADKLVDPYFTMLWSEAMPTLRIDDERDRRTDVTVIAGAVAGHDARPVAPPPNSWAARPDADVAIWHLRMDPDATWSLPAAAGPDTVRTLYVFDGSGVDIGGHAVEAGTGAVVRCDEAVALTAGTDGVEILVLQGRPIGEPVARYGPFVMNTSAEIRQAAADYHRTGFGGWPWDSPAPDHGVHEGRFARHADGRLDRPSSTGA